MKRAKDNIATKSDSYKSSHYPQYPPGTTIVGSYAEARGTENPEITETMWYGLQYIAIEHLVGQVITKELVDEAEIFWNQHFGTGFNGKPAVTFNKEGWMHIVENHGGKLPVRIKAVPEGTLVPLKNVLMTIENTDPKCFWLTNFLETILMQVWYPTTIASNSYACKKLILKYLEETGTPESIIFKLHDFGFRGVSSYETAAIGGSAHLLNFMGTDTVPGIILLMNYYNAEMCGFSVAATEHSTMTSWGKESEAEAYANALKQYENAPILSIVSDSYDIFNAVEKIYGEQLKDLILSRPGKLVVRPDSGDPVEVNRKLLHILWDKFGGTTNDKGYKLLDPHVGIIQGDGIDYREIGRILDMAYEEGFSADNIVFGSGGGLLQKFNRDSLKFAIKCSYIVIDGVEHDVSKDPITAAGKKSKAGRLKLVKNYNTGEYSTVSSKDFSPALFDNLKDELVTVFENGELLVTYTLDQIKANAINKTIKLETDATI